LLYIKYRQIFFDKKRQEYFIDRHRRTFEVIANFINNGKYLIRPDDIPIDVFVTELAFYSLGRETVENFLNNEGLLRDERRFDQDSNCGEMETPPIGYTANPSISFVWKMCEDPSSSLVARLYSILSVILIFLSIGIFCAETLPNVRKYNSCNSHRYHHETTPLVTNQNICVSLPEWLLLMRKIEDICLGWFTIELFVRFFVCPAKRRFCSQPLNIIDAIAVFPSLVSMMADMDELVFLKTLRALRILKMARYSRGLRVLGQTIIMSKRVILLQCAFHAIMATTFGACFIFLEGSRKDKQNLEPPKKYTIIDGLWWAVITMTTVGYGDVFPQVLIFALYMIDKILD